MLPFLSKLVTRKDCRDVAKMHAESEATMGRLDDLVNQGHKLRTGHPYEAENNSDECATCMRDTHMARNVEEAEERLRRCARGACLTAECSYDRATRSLVCSACGKSEFCCAHPMSVPCVHCKES